MSVRFAPTPIAGCLEFSLNPVRDRRGSFLKLFQFSKFRECAPDFQVKECFVSTSARGAIRGLHFQVPPHDHDKIVICEKGKAFDVVVDLRRSQPTYGKTLSFELDSERRGGLFIPRGCAHGFQALEDDTVVFYLTGSEHEPSSDQGIRWDSCGADWPLEATAISERDRAFPALGAFRSPFP